MYIVRQLFRLKVIKTLTKVLNELMLRMLVDVHLKTYFEHSFAGMRNFNMNYTSLKVFFFLDSFVSSKYMEVGHAFAINVPVFFFECEY